MTEMLYFTPQDVLSDVLCYPSHQCKNQQYVS